MNGFVFLIFFFFFLFNGNDLWGGQRKSLVFYLFLLFYNDSGGVQRFRVLYPTT